MEGAFDTGRNQHEEGGGGEANKPTERFLEVTQQIAEALHLDGARLAAGTPVQIGSLTFQIIQYGQRDPDGLYIFLHMQVPSEGGRELIYKQFLTQNAITPAAAGGYWALLPRTESPVFCVRMNLAAAPSPCEGVLAYIEICAQQMERMGQMQKEVLDAAERVARAKQSEASAH